MGAHKRKAEAPRRDERGGGEGLELLIGLVGRYNSAYTSGPSSVI